MRVLYFFIFLSLFFVSSAEAKVTINFKETLETTTSSVPTFINELYLFAIGIGGILAVGAIIVGGVMYIAEGAVPQKKTEGKNIILGALWGLALVVGAFVILKTINPRLVELDNPGGNLEQAYTEGCTEEYITINTGGGGTTKKRLPECKIDEWPRDPKTGDCRCWASPKWQTGYVENFDSSEGETISTYDCTNPLKLTGKAAGEAVVSTGKSFSPDKITYCNGPGYGCPHRDRPDLGWADCSGFISYLYKCVLSAGPLGNSGAQQNDPLPSTDKIERFLGADKESKTKVGDIIGMDRACKAKYMGKVKFGHVMIVAEKSGNTVTKILDVSGKAKVPNKGGAHLRNLGSTMGEAWRDCGYTIHIKGND